MILKPLIVLSLVLNLIGFNFSAGQMDKKLADYYTREEYQLTKADTTIQVDNISIAPTIKSTAQPPYINTKNYLLLDGETGDEIIGKVNDTRVAIASLTKIMTAIIVLENYNLEQVATVPYEATIQTPTIVYLRTGEKITIRELLHCLLIKSGNDSAYTLATNINDSNSDISPFVDLMNTKASQLGMYNTRFNDPAGLSDEGYSTASDMGILTRYALLNPVIQNIIKTEKYVASNTTKTIFHQLENSNRLVTIYQYPGAIGVKTGFTYEASHCLIGAAKRNGHTLIAIILGTYVDSATASADEARDLLDWGFENVLWSN